MRVINKLQLAPNVLVIWEKCSFSRPMLYSLHNYTGKQDKSVTPRHLILTN